MSALKFSDGSAWSYSTRILHAAGKLTIGNVTYYTKTTLKHQMQAKVFGADVLLDEVPVNTGDLLKLAIERGKIKAEEKESI